jgi:hypothetical protein
MDSLALVSKRSNSNADGRIGTGAISTSGKR